MNFYFFLLVALDSITHREINESTPIGRGFCRFCPSPALHRAFGAFVRDLVLRFVHEIKQPPVVSKLKNSSVAFFAPARYNRYKSNERRNVRCQSVRESNTIGRRRESLKVPWPRHWVLLRKRSRNGKRGFPKLKDTTLKTHAYITSKAIYFGGKPHGTPYILWI